ncbi:GNAT family N-acetyltransferase [Halalkalibacter hemicellulosilyticus]|uniref:GNAT family acetyltransferase YjcF n=1 Tax=Halalkalibacter hemicellulosilyticusJCM 9152 TaxID=1236971 RepID=W4QF76_9BACI|nr:GNAT family N-acetyltransferase [Halalkalibacter hemicellulosilyticus]GAE30755.1 GNAT family acetyltransferase YjcF [Halalkalibacter hemicellulosilyticusJCM 9152]
MEIIQVTNKDQRQDAYDVRTKVFVSEQQVPLNEEIDQYEEEAIHFVMYNNGLPVGAGRLRFIEDFGKIERICLLKEARGTGAGQALMKKIQETAYSNGYNKLKLNAQCQAEGFYKKLGYVTVSNEPFLDAGIPHVTMEKNL